MADVVGTAFVRIKALTNNIAKDIEKGVAKGAKDANVGKSGESVGDNLGKGIKKGLNNSIDSKGLAGFKARILKAMGLDEESGKKSGRKFGRGILGAIVKFGALFSPAVLGVGSLLVQYVTALVSQIGLLGIAAAGAGVALGTVLGAAALGVLPLVLAFKANTAELAKFKEVAGEVGKAWQEVGAATQETLLPGLTQALKTTKKLIPEFRAFGREIGKVAGGLAHMVAHEVADDQERLQTILRGSSRIFDSLAGAVFNFFTIFLDVFEAAIPIGEQFAASIEKVSDRWQNLIGESADSGRLTETFQGWYDKASLVGIALRDLVVAMGNIFSVGADSAVPFFENFATWAAEFRAFTESATGQNKLKQIFDDANEVAHEFNGLIVDIFNVIGGQVFASGGNDGIIGFIRVLREDFVPLMDGFATKLKEDYGPALSEFFKAFGDFLVQVAKADGLNITLKTLTLTFQAFTIALETLLKIPGFASFLGILLGVGGALKIIGGAFKLIKGTGIVSLFSALGSVLGVVYGVAQVLAAALGIGLGAALGIVAAAIAAVIGAVVLLVIHWDTVVEAVKAVGRALFHLGDRFGLVWDRIKSFASWLKREFLKVFDKVKEKFGEIVESIGEFAGSIGEKIGEAAGAIKEGLGGAFTGALEAAKKFPGQVVRALAGFGKTVGTGLIDGLKALPGLLGDALNAAAHFAFEALRATIHRLIQGVILVIVGVPALMLIALTELGPKLIEAFQDAFEFLARNLTTIVGAVLNFFQDLPGNVVEALSNFGTAIASFFTDTAWPVVTGAVSTGVEAAIQFFKDLPGNVVSALDTLGEKIRSIFFTALETAKTVVSGAIDGIVGFFTKLPGRILSAVATLGETVLGIGSTIMDKLLAGLGAAPGKIVELAGKLFDAVGSLGRKLINGVIGALNDLLPNEIGAVKVAGREIFGGINLPDNPIPLLKAEGDIFRRATNIIAGEAGAEVLIPLTRPRRALELFNQSGLAEVLARAQGSSRPGATGAVSGRGGVVFQEGAVQVVAQGVSATAVIDEVNAKLGWQLTTRGDR